MIEDLWSSTVPHFSGFGLHVLPDGQTAIRIAQDENDFSTELIQFSLDGSTEERVLDADSFEGASADGERLLLWNRSETGFDYFVVDTSTQDTVIDLTRQGVLRASLSPSGETLAYLVRLDNGQTQLATVDLSTGEELLIGEAIAATEVQPVAFFSQLADSLSWSADGEHLAISNGEGIWRANLSDQTLEPVETEVVGAVGGPVLSPDGSQLLFTESRLASEVGVEFFTQEANGPEPYARALHLLDLSSDESGPRQLQTFAEVEYFPLWSPDGGEIVLGTMGTGATLPVSLVEIVNPQNGEAQLIPFGNEQSGLIGFGIPLVRATDGAVMIVANVGETFTLQAASGDSRLILRELPSVRNNDIELVISGDDHFTLVNEDKPTGLRVDLATNDEVEVALGDLELVEFATNFGLFDLARQPELLQASHEVANTAFLDVAAQLNSRDRVEFVRNGAALVSTADRPRRVFDTSTGESVEFLVGAELFPDCDDELGLWLSLIHI